MHAYEENFGGFETQKPRSVRIRRGFLNERRGSPNGVAVSAQRQKGKSEVEADE